jgi:hypothetical protein
MNKHTISMDKINVISYQELLKNIEESENHLLLGNGFNRGLGINTSYKAIFEEMINKRHSLYGDITTILKGCNYDLEVFIGKLIEDISNDFLKKFISNKIKLDFMEATHSIVKKSIKHVFAEENEGIFILLKNFTNYFTINYDEFLYILLLQYKKNNVKKVTIGFPDKIKWIEDDINAKGNNIYEEIKELRNRGIVTIRNVNSDCESNMSMLPKTHFVEEVVEYGKKNGKNWTKKEINRITKYILEEEKNNEVLTKVEDGFEQLALIDDFVFKKDKYEQNLFFLHGAFHIYKDKNKIKKITSKTDKALYSRLEEVINEDRKEIVTVFQTMDKQNTINENEYLKYCYDKLKTLRGSVVIIGSSLAENDKHIFNSINDSSVEKVYISTFGDERLTYEKASNYFDKKQIVLFDAKSISYKL